MTSTRAKLPYWILYEEGSFSKPLKIMDNDEIQRLFQEYIQQDAEFQAATTNRKEPMP